MKFKLFLILIAIISSVYTVWAIPSTLNIQGQLTNSDGTISSGTHNLSFRIYDLNSGGTSLWEENQTLTLTNGTYSANLGELISLNNLSFESQYYLGVNIGEDSEMVPRLNFTSVPYSFFSRNAENVSCVGCINVTKILDATITQAKLAFAPLLRTDNVAFKNATDETFQNNLTVEDSLITDFIFSQNNSVIAFLGASIGIGTKEPTVKLNVTGEIDASQVYVNGTAVATNKITFEGYTSTTHAGGMGGVQGMGDLCNAAFAGSHACTYTEVLQLGTGYTYASDSWLIDGAYTDGTRQVTQDGNENTASNNPLSTHCSGWSTNSSSFQGPFISTSGNLQLQTCDTVEVIACCS